MAETLLARTYGSAGTTASIADTESTTNGRGVTFNVPFGEWTSTKIIFTLFKGNAPGAAVVELYAADGDTNLPTGDVLDSVAVPELSGSPGIAIEFELVGDMEHGNKYAAVIRATEAWPPASYILCRRTTYLDVYKQSNMVCNLKKVGANWRKEDVPDDDFWILTQIWGNAAAIPPGKPVNPTPTDGASDITLDATSVTWEDGGTGANAATSYNIYQGTLSGFLSLVESGIDDLSYALRSTNWPNYGQARYWRIDSVNSYGTTTGDEWYFTTLIFRPPTPSGVTWDDPGNDTGYTGTPTGVNNLITVRRLVAAANDAIYYET